MGFKRPEVRIFSLGPAKSPVFSRNTGLFLFSGHTVLTLYFHARCQQAQSTVSMKWKSSNYNYMQFKLDDYNTTRPRELYELSDGSTFGATLRPFAISRLAFNPNFQDTGYYLKEWTVVTNETAVEPCTGTPVYSAGPNKIKFTCTYFTEGQKKDPNDEKSPITP